jgi:4-diphosphocytidyl-2C-methyl-D-erythritol kinase
MSRQTLTLTCPAKVNLALSVGAPAEEDGLHPICSWMIAVEFGDTLKLHRAEADTSSFAIHPAPDAPLVQPIDWLLERDLAHRAHALLQKELGRRLPTDLVLEKRIPSGAGFGGGSSDAAGVLVGLNTLFDLNLAERDLAELGLKLGSDVAYLVRALHGCRSATVGGYGGEITATVIELETHVILILAPLRCSTADVYRRFDQLAPDAEVDEDRVMALTRSPAVPNDRLFNDLVDAAFEVNPELRRWHHRLGEATSAPVYVSGSGAGMFALADSPAEAERIRAQVGSAGLAAVVTRVPR